ncbi:MAG: TetR family transcriptional regulator [Gammaproteobacteria bacterium]|nr:TetR family transcriptional regulator [Gammaproteobacteria bacterium]MDE0270209.1 TetR family transcriptional regulator [Gammaproteobacteria bacterium]
MGNRERIVAAAVELMNKSGSVVGTTQLAAHLSISPGNLYYHFRNREEILAEVLARLTSDLDAVLELPPGEQPDAHRLAEIFIGGAKVLWQYRFFFSSPLELVMKDEQLVDQYRRFCARGTAQVDAILERVLRIAAGPQELSTAERGKLAENLWVLWTSWSRYVEIVAGAQVPEREILRNHEHLELLLKPYLDPDFYASVVSRTRKVQVLEGPTPDSPRVRQLAPKDGLKA